jgi:hypothetical protein
MELAPDLLIPHVPASQLALVEPDLDARGAERFANPLGCLRVLRGIAKKNRVRRLRHQEATPEVGGLIEPPSAAA